MRKLHFMSTEDYSAILHMRSSGELAEERENKALLVFMDKLSAINKRKDRQLLCNCRLCRSRTSVKSYKLERSN